MLNTGKKIRGLRDKKINILTLVLSEKKILNETKNHNLPPPPFKLNDRSLMKICISKNKHYNGKTKKNKRTNKDLQKNYTEDNSLSNKNPTKHRGVPYMFTVPAPLVTSVVL